MIDYEYCTKMFKIMKNNQKVEDICNELKLTTIEFKGLIEILSSMGYDITIQNENGIDIIKKRNIIKTSKNIKPNINNLNHLKICIVSDTHLCTTIQQLGLLNKVYKEAYKRGITTFLHCGDLLDGDFTKIRPDQNYQLFRRGFDEQVGYAIDMYPHIKGCTTYFIEGSHDQTHVKNGGATPGTWINKLRNDMVYLGTPQAKIEFNKVVFMLQHPGGGCARSLSYKPQIAIDEMETKEKPNIFLQGHFHKAYGTVYRNVHTFLVPSFMDQSGFMQMNNLKSIIGAYFFDIYSDKLGHIEYFDVEPINFDIKDIDKFDYKHVKKLTIN